MTLFNILLYIHVAGGTTGLICGTIAASVVKGKKAHIINGKLFSIGMIAAAISALIISNMPGHNNVFLFAVGGFTFYMVTTGNRMVHLKRHYSKSIIDYSLLAFGTVFSLFLLFLGAKSLLSSDFFGVVPIVFAAVCLVYVKNDVMLLTGKYTIKSKWMLNHITRMMGALIASYTAFIVVNIQVQMQWILWLAPSLAGGILIRSFIKKYVPAKSGN